MKKADAAFERLLPTKYNCMGIPMAAAYCWIRSANTTSDHIDPTHIEEHSVDKPHRVAVGHNGHYSPVDICCVRLKGRRPQDWLTEASLTSGALKSSII